MAHITDPIELIVSRGLYNAGIGFNHESDGDCPLDFYLWEHDVHIECKQFHSDRSNEQLSRRANVILIQGRKAADAFASFLIEGC